MTWKSTAVVSGLGLVATWLGVYTPFQIPDATPGPAPSAAVASSPAPDIEQQADRLAIRVRQETLYREPSRNPFRFTTRAAPAAPRTAPAASPAPEPQVPAEPLPPPLRLVGVASDVVDGAPQRTAIVSGAGGVQLVKVGDEIAGYRVSAVEDDAVELTSTADGAPMRLRLGR